MSASRPRRRRKGPRRLQRATLSTLEVSASHAFYAAPWHCTLRAPLRSRRSSASAQPSAHAEATVRAKDAAVTGLKKVVGAGGDEDKDEPKASWLENPLANKGADIEKAAIESNAPTKPTEVSKDKEGNMRRSLGKSGAAEHEPKPKY